MEKISSTERFKKARDFLLHNRNDYETAVRDFVWPEFETFNWALDWFDFYAQGNNRTALHIVRKGGQWTEEKYSFSELSTRTSRIARHFEKIGIKRGDRILIMLPNVVELWEVSLAAMKMGAVIVPTTTQATEPEIKDRMSRGNIHYLICDQESRARIDACGLTDLTKILVGTVAPGWYDYSLARVETELFTPTAPTLPNDPMLLYFTSGTTAKAKLVQHTHQSYPVGHLSTLYWIGLQEKSLHQNISSPGWAKHAWSSFFAPWNAGATIFVHDSPRFSPKETLEVLNKFKVTSLCAPPTVWRMLILEDLGAKPSELTDLVGAGEPLNPEVIETIEKNWGLRIRDGFGQTETTLVVGNSPGQEIKLGSMGRPMPGYRISLRDAGGRIASEGELSLDLSPRPHGLMKGYADDEEKTRAVMQGGYYRTGDEATVDDEGYYFYVGRGDDVFKSSDYRISPFELESFLLEHEAVAEAAIIPSPHAIRLNVPKAFIVLKPGFSGDEMIARSIFDFCAKHLPNYKRIRRLEFSVLPKTISGKIRRVQLRNQEKERISSGKRGEFEFWADEIERG